MSTRTDDYRAIPLDAALRQVAVLDFEIPNRFVNHGPMACEALDTLGFGSALDPWARSFTATVPPDAQPIPARLDATFEWASALGDHRTLPHWIAFFEANIKDDGWEDTVATWVPRLIPGLAAALFHGAIRTAHAVRALDHNDTPERRDELARALAHWSIWFQVGEDTHEIDEVNDVRIAVVEAAAHGARRYTAAPNVFTLHGVTGAMAIEILIHHLSPGASLVALAHLRSELGALYRESIDGAVEHSDRLWDPRVEVLAAASYDPHQIKLVEACKRGYEAIGGDSFLEASEIVTDSVGY